jgi:hypothetical protein
MVQIIILIGLIIFVIAATVPPCMLSSRISWREKDQE